MNFSTSGYHPLVRDAGLNSISIWAFLSCHAHLCPCLNIVVVHLHDTGNNLVYRHIGDGAADNNSQMNTWTLLNLSHNLKIAEQLLKQSQRAPAYVKMEIPVLLWSLKSSVLSLTSFQIDQTFWRVASAAVGRLGTWGVHFKYPVPLGRWMIWFTIRAT